MHTHTICSGLWGGWEVQTFLFLNCTSRNEGQRYRSGPAPGATHTHTQNTAPYPDCGVMVQYLGLFLKLCMLTENKSFKFLNVSCINTLPKVDSSYNTDTLRQTRHSHSTLTFLIFTTLITK